jgi:hypothetical protein
MLLHSAVQSREVRLWMFGEVKWSGNSQIKYLKITLY